MQNTRSLCIRFLLLITGGLTQCLSLKQISVLQGDTLTLKCHFRNTNMLHALEWKNPKDFLLFFNREKVLKDKRNTTVTLTATKFSLSVPDIKFKDGGVYKCLHYKHRVSVKRYKVTVIGAPKLEIYEQEDKTMLKCSASANEHPPVLSWVMDNGLEIAAHPYYEYENASNKYTAVSQLSLKVPSKKVTVKCLVRHPALYSSELDTFIHLGDQRQDTSTSSSTTLGSTGTTVIPTLFSITSFTNSQSESETTNYSNTTVNETKEGTSSSGRTNILSNTTANETAETTEGMPSNTSNTSLSNNTGNDDTRFDTRIKKGNSALLVLLVTCLIICLVVVLTFFLVRLRKAHMAWKKENEESDQSVESNKSKSSSEEKQKQKQQQRGRGFLKTSFTKYKVEEEQEAQATPTSVVNENPQHFISRSSIKETEL